MTELERAGQALAMLLRGGYALDEVACTRGGAPALAFRRSGRTVFIVVPQKEAFDVVFTLPKAACAAFESDRDRFSQEVQTLYDGGRALCRGRRLTLRLRTVKDVAFAAQLMRICKKPDRKPLPAQGAVTAKCGHRCDWCIHYQGMSEQTRDMIRPHLDRVYGDNGWTARCPGCGVQQAGKPHPCMNGDSCRTLDCARDKGLSACTDCALYPCPDATAGYRALEIRDLSADDITYAVLPYAPQRRE